VVVDVDAAPEGGVIAGGRVRAGDVLTGPGGVVSPQHVEGQDHPAPVPLRRLGKLPTGAVAAPNVGTIDQATEGPGGQVVGPLSPSLARRPVRFAHRPEPLLRGRACREECSCPLSLFPLPAGWTLGRG